MDGRASTLPVLAVVWPSRVTRSTRSSNPSINCWALYLQAIAAFGRTLLLCFPWLVDPYPISEPFSTAGKINLNYQMAPFTHINRSTGIHALLKSIQVGALQDSLATGVAATHYKGDSATLPDTFPSAQVRFNVDASKTLTGFSQKFSAPDGAFKSATEISEIFLVPQGRTYANTPSWWSDKRLTGDNTREAPYAQLLPRVTTKSNTYTVHFRVQALKQVPGWRTNAADWGRWDEARDQVLSEYRGSASIERYVDPNDPTLPDFALPANYTNNLASCYRWRNLEKR